MRKWFLQIGKINYFRRLEFREKSHLGWMALSFYCTFTYCSIGHDYYSTSLGSYLILELGSSDHSVYSIDMLLQNKVRMIYDNFLHLY